MNGKKARRIRNEVMEKFPAANLPSRLTEQVVVGEERAVTGPLKWNRLTQRSLYKQAKKESKVK